MGSKGLLVRNMVDICYIRTFNRLACCNCIYYGKQCEEFKKRWKVERPAGILKERKIKNGT